MDRRGWYLRARSHGHRIRRLHSQFGTLAPFGSASGVGSDRRNRSEVGVGRVILPLALEVNDKLALGGSVDYRY